MNRKHLWGAVLVLGLLTAAILVACGGQPAPEAAPSAAVDCPEPEACPECEECPEVEASAVDTVPFEAAWAASPHADSSAEAFNHWNEEDPQEVPTSCAKCHSTPGYIDFMGADGSAFGAVDAAAPIGTVITCEACHNEAAASLDSVVFPSGVELTGLGPSARCMECHQGRASGATVDEALAELGLTEDLDTPNEELGFINIHYYAAAASLFGSEVHGGYEYAGNSYQIRFTHVEGYQTCADCHNQHSLEVRVEECAACHTGVTGTEDLKNVRMQGSLVDYDGDGDREEGIYYELQGLQELLYQAMQAYSAEVGGTPIIYDGHTYPYFFIDTNGDGEAGEDEVNYGNQYVGWTGRLLQAAYNYQVSLKDPGAFAHSAKYHIQLLYDSIESLNSALSSPVDLSAAHRDDAGHFDATAEAFRHWDEDDPSVVPGSCAKCHSAGGLPQFLAEGTTISAPPSNSLSCKSCHSSYEDFSLYEVTDVTFPSGATVSFGEGVASNLCLECHQGRSSTTSVNSRVAGKPADVVDESLGFINIHYFAAGATLFGTDAKGAYEYDGKTYLGQFGHVEGFNTCADCHNVHALEVKTEACASCHGGAEPHDIRMGDPVDYDGDGDTDEGIYGEIETMREVLYQAMQDYAAGTIGTPLVYDGSAYPYFFIDTNGDGEPTPDEANYGNQYASWTPKLVKAAFNFQYASKDPGAFAHNGKYVIQFLYDSIQDIGGDVSGMTRP